MAKSTFYDFPLIVVAIFFSYSLFLSFILQLHIPETVLSHRASSNPVINYPWPTSVFRSDRLSKYLAETKQNRNFTQ